MTNIGGLTYDTLKPLVKRCLENRVSVLVLGHPGVGKSTMAKELAEEFGLPLVEIRLAHVDPSELVGVQMPDKETKKLIHYIPEWVPVDQPAFIFLDEINAGVTKLHQAAAYQIVLDRRAGSVSFHPDTVIMAAGNLEEDNAIVTTLSSALNNRFAHFILQPDVDCWLKWAAENNITPVTRAYIKFRGLKGLYNNTGEPAFPTPRSVAMADRLVKDLVMKPKKTQKEEVMIKRLVASCIGEGDAVQYVEFLRTFANIDLEGIIFKGKEIPSQEPSFLYALTFGAADFIGRTKNVVKYIDKIAHFVKRLPPEYSMVFFHEIAQAKNTRNLLSKLAICPELAKRIDFLTDGMNIL